jgi:hypothetical protein
MNAYPSMATMTPSGTPSPMPTWAAVERPLLEAVLSGFEELGSTRPKYGDSFGLKVGEVIERL